MRTASILLCCLGLLAFAGCGENDAAAGLPTPEGQTRKAFTQQLAEASQVAPSDFPAAGGRTLQAIAATAGKGPEAVAATSVFVPGKNRIAFGVPTVDYRPVYGKTALYVADATGGAARGPFPAPADSLVTAAAFRSRTAATEDSPLASIYAAEVTLPEPGRYTLLAYTRSGTKTYTSQLPIEVKADSPIPAVGQRAPRVETDTIAGAGGDLKSIDTRLPAAPDLHRTSFADAVGKKPVALLFATPQLCQSRVCGPVADIALQLQAKYGDRVTFIHQEVYRGNRVQGGLRKPLIAFGLQTEPWLFTVDHSGRIAARLEGSFGQRAFEDAIKAALR